MYANSGAAASGCSLCCSSGFLVMGGAGHPSASCYRYGDGLLASRRRPMRHAQYSSQAREDQLLFRESPGMCRMTTPTSHPMKRACRCMLGAIGPLKNCPTRLSVPRAAYAYRGSPHTVQLSAPYGSRPRHTYVNNRMTKANPMGVRKLYVILSVSMKLNISLKPGSEYYRF